MAKATINPEVCKGCGLCVTACPKKIIAISTEEINSKGYYPAKCMDQSKCIGCAFCGIICPDCAITVEK